MASLVLTCIGLEKVHRIRCTLLRSQLSSAPITSEPVPIPPFYKRLQIAWVVVSTVQVRNMRYVVGRDRQAATGQLLINPHHKQYLYFLLGLTLF
jgi:hypothetical protein